MFGCRVSCIQVKKLRPFVCESLRFSWNQSLPTSLCATIDSNGHWIPASCSSSRQCSLCANNATEEGAPEWVGFRPQFFPASLYFFGDYEDTMGALDLMLWTVCFWYWFAAAEIGHGGMSMCMGFLRELRLPVLHRAKLTGMIDKAAYEARALRKCGITVLLCAFHVYAAMLQPSGTGITGLRRGSTPGRTAQNTLTSVTLASNDAPSPIVSIRSFFRRDALNRVFWLTPPPFSTVAVVLSVLRS